MNILIKGGSLSFWGVWFGRPCDNFHVPINAELDGGVLTICFDEGEKCVVYDPFDIVNEPNDFHVKRASKIVWEWYYYGRKQAPENLFRWEFALDGGKVCAKYSGAPALPDVPNACKYALQMC